MALLTAEACEKIRVNPGNFADGAKKFTVINYENEVRGVALRCVARVSRRVGLGGRWGLTIPTRGLDRWLPWSGSLLTRSLHARIDPHPSAL